jgi:tetratricopeptide (TPR) repeat protein
MSSHACVKGERPIKIVKERAEEYALKAELQGRQYIILSEEVPGDPSSLMTRALYNGEILVSHKVSVGLSRQDPDFAEKFSGLVRGEQERTLGRLRLDLIQKRRAYRDYIREIESLMTARKEPEADELLREALGFYPRNLTLLSYQGLITSSFYCDTSRGIALCEEAVKCLRDQMSLIESYFSPTLYLNLGKVYLTANRRKQAYEAFRKGLESDTKNRHLIQELQRFGKRRKPVFPFLDRGHRLNKWCGQIVSSINSR